MSDPEAPQSRAAEPVARGLESVPEARHGHSLQRPGYQKTEDAPSAAVRGRPTGPAVKRTPEPDAGGA